MTVSGHREVPRVLEEHVTHAERVGFIAAVERNERTFCEICERFEIIRKTGYKWLARYEELGPAGLVDRSRRPHHSPNATLRRVVEALEELRRRHPTWGAGKLLGILEGRHPTWQLPVSSETAAARVPGSL